MMKTTTTESSTFVKRVAYCADCKTLRIKFVRGGVYEYADVPAWVHTQFISAHSVGRYFQNEIKGKYVSTCLVRPDDTTGTLRYRLDKHVCHAAQVIPIQDNQTEIASRIFGTGIVEVVYRIKGDSNIYTSRQLLEKAIADKERTALHRKLMGMMIGSSLDSTEARYNTANFIIANRKLLKEIL